MASNTLWLRCLVCLYRLAKKIVDYRDECVAMAGPDMERKDAETDDELGVAVGKTTMNCTIQPKRTFWAWIYTSRTVAEGKLSLVAVWQMLVPVSKCRDYVRLCLGSCLVFQRLGHG